MTARIRIIVLKDDATARNRIRGHMKCECVAEREILLSHCWSDLLYMCGHYMNSCAKLILTSANCQQLLRKSIPTETGFNMLSSARNSFHCYREFGTENQGGRIQTQRRFKWEVNSAYIQNSIINQEV